MFHDGQLNLKFFSLNINNVKVTPSGVCSAPMSQPQTKMVCCCSMGKGWGRECQLCPGPNSPEYSELCGSGGPGQIVDPMTGRYEKCLKTFAFTINQGFV